MSNIFNYMVKKAPTALIAIFILSMLCFSSCKKDDAVPVIFKSCKVSTMQYKFWSKPPNELTLDNPDHQFEYGFGYNDQNKVEEVSRVMITEFGSPFSLCSANITYSQDQKTSKLELCPQAGYLPTSSLETIKDDQDRIAELTEIQYLSKFGTDADVGNKLTYQYDEGLLQTVYSEYFTMQDSVITIQSRDTALFEYREEEDLPFKVTFSSSNDVVTLEFNDLAIHPFTDPPAMFMAIYPLNYLNKSFFSYPRQISGNEFNLMYWFPFQYTVESMTYNGSSVSNIPMVTSKNNSNYVTSYEVKLNNACNTGCPYQDLHMKVDIGYDCD